MHLVILHVNLKKILLIEISFLNFVFLLIHIYITHYFTGFIVRKVLNLGLKAEKPLQNENPTEDWALGSHPCDNGHVTH